MHELYGTGNFNRADLSDEQLKRRHELVKELRLLRSDVYEDGTMKNMENLHKSSVLNTYITSMRNLNEEYFEKEVVEGFEENLEYYLDIIKRYEANHPYETLDERLKDDNYLDAYNWLKANTIRRVDSELRDQISQAFKDLGANYEFKNAYKWYLDKHPEIIDVDGVVDGTKVPEAVIKELKLLLNVDMLWIAIILMLLLLLENFLLIENKLMLNSGQNLVLVNLMLMMKF